MDDKLGGFALRGSEIDANFEEWCAFNYCLAEEYYYAIKTESFDLIGPIDANTLRLVQFWFNYNGCNDDKEEEIKNISRGLIITDKGRTFADAVIAEGIGYLAYPLIANGNNDIRLYQLNKRYLERFDAIKVKKHINL